MEYMYILFLGLAFLMLFASAEWFYHKRNGKVEHTRKYVHAVTGLLSLSFPILLDNHLSVLFLCGSFLLILLLSLKFNFLPSINNIDRVSKGSILYPIVVYGSYMSQSYFDNLLYFYLPILILAISDPMAALAGKKWPIGKYHIAGQSKTLMGSAAFFISAFLLSATALCLMTNIEGTFCLYISFSIALMCTIAEGLSINGYDNLTIPLIGQLALIYFSENIYA